MRIMRMLRSGCITLLLHCSLTRAVAAAEWLPTIAPGITVLAGHYTPGQQPDGNSVLVDTAAGALLFDSGRHVSHTAALRVRIEAGGVPLKLLVNSHWHLDHIAGNPMLRRAFPEVRVLGSGAVRQALATGGFLDRYRSQLAEQLARTDLASAARDQYRAEIARIDAGPALFPDEVVTAGRTLELGGQRFELHLEARAVTAGDLWLYAPAARLVLAGDLVTFPAPFLDTACAARWQQVLGKIERLDFRQLVPGHGPLLDHAGFVRWRKAYDGLLACAGANTTAGVCADAWVRGLGPLLPPAQQRFTRAMIGYYVDEVLRLPEGQHKACAPA